MKLKGYIYDDLKMKSILHWSNKAKDFPSVLLLGDVIFSDPCGNSNTEITLTLTKDMNKQEIQKETIEDLRKEFPSLTSSELQLITITMIRYQEKLNSKEEEDTN